MADTKLTDLTELAEAPATSDVVEVVDVSDTTHDAAGTSKKLTVQNLLNVLSRMTAKTTPVDADSFPMVDSEASDATKRVTGTNFKAYLKTYFDTLYALSSHSHTASDISDFDTEVANNAAVALNTAKVGVTTEEANPDVVSQVEAEAGTATTERIWTAERVKQAIVALGGAGGASELADLSDVDATVGSPSDGDILVFRSAGSNWILEAKPAGGSNPAMADITDVTITSISTGEVLQWNGSAFVNQTFAEMGLSVDGHEHTASEITDFDTEVGNNSAVTANTAKVGVTTEISNVSEDTTPQAGGDFDMNGYDLLDVQGLILDGTPDADHSATGAQTDTFNAGETIAAGEVVYMHTDGEWHLADASVTATAEKDIAIALEAGTDGNPLQVALSGAFVRDDSWSWTAGDTLYLSLTAGDLSATVTATATDEVSRVIGYAYTSTVIRLAPQQGVVHA
jgi:hypothetical protein